MDNQADPAIMLRPAHSMARLIKSPLHTHLFLVTPSRYTTLCIYSNINHPLPQ